MMCQQLCVLHSLVCIKIQMINIYYLMFPLLKHVSSRYWHKNDNDYNIWHSLVLTYDTTQQHITWQEDKTAFYDMTKTYDITLNDMTKHDITHYDMTKNMTSLYMTWQTHGITHYGMKKTHDMVLYDMTKTYGITPYDMTKTHVSKTMTWTTFTTLQNELFSAQLIWFPWQK